MAEANTHPLSVAVERHLENERLRAALVRLCSVALAAKASNTPEFMAGLLERCNDACEALGDPDRFRLAGVRQDLLRFEKVTDAP